MSVPISYFNKGSRFINIQQLNSKNSLQKQLFKSERQKKRQMLKVSSNSITFSESQTIKSLTLQNQFHNNIIFKIKVSLVGYLSIQPNKGFIRANSSVPFIIKSLQNQKFQVKVLFTYGIINQKNYDFNQEWDQIKQNSKFQHSIIIVKRTQPYRPNPKIQSFINQTQRPESMLNFNQTSKLSQRKPSIQKKPNQKSVYKTNSEQRRKMSPRKEFDNYEQFSRQIYVQEEPRDACPFYSTQEMQELIKELDKCSKSLQTEKIKSIKLNQQLSISQGKLKEITEDKMYIETHKSIGIVCEDYHTTFTVLVIIGLACFVFGFLLGKIQAQIV